MEGNKGMCSAHGHQGLAQAARCLDGKQAAKNAARELFGVFGSRDRTTKKLELQDISGSHASSRFFFMPTELKGQQMCATGATVTPRARSIYI